MEEKDTLTQALKFLIQDVKNLQDRLSAVESDKEKQLAELEQKILDLNNDIAQLKSEYQYTKYNTASEEDLKTWMLDESSKDATDLPMTKNDIAKGFVDFAKRSGVRVTK